MATNAITPSPTDVQAWWDELEFEHLIRITGYHPTDFNPEDGYQDFVDACNDYWNELDEFDKMRIYRDFH